MFLFSIIVLIIVFTLSSIFIKIKLTNYIPVPYKKISLKDSGWWCLLYVILIILCLNKPEDTPDYSMYKEFYGYIRNGLDSFFEPTYVIISKNVNNFSIVLFIYAFLSIGAKLLAIKSLSPYKPLSLLCYCSLFFLLADVVQIRAAVASGIFLFAINYLWKNKKNIYIFFIIIACLFHYSSLCLFFLLFLNPKKINIRNWTLLIVLIFIMSIFNLSIGKLLTLINLSSFTKYDYYISGNNTSGVGLLLYIRLLVALMVTINIKRIQKHYPVAILCVKIYIISLVVMPLFNDLYLVAGRLNELLGIVEIIIVALIPFISLRNKEPLKLISVMFCLSLFYMRGLLLVK